MLMALVTTPLQAGADAPKVGERHPDFTLPSIATGKPLSLSDFRGKKVLLIQFASW
jgi:peroxiredoxin